MRKEIREMRGKCLRWDLISYRLMERTGYELEGIWELKNRGGVKKLGTVQARNEVTQAIKKKTIRSSGEGSETKEKQVGK